MIQLNDANFQETVKENERFLAMFYMETGCSHCEKMKPLFAEYALKSNAVCGMYPLIREASKVATELKIKNAPTFVAYVNGQAVNVQSGGEVDLDAMFTPPPVTIEKAAMLQLLTDEASLIDQIYPLREHLKLVQAEIAKRRGSV